MQSSTSQKWSAGSAEGAQFNSGLLFLSIIVFEIYSCSVAVDGVDFNHHRHSDAAATGAADG